MASADALGRLWIGTMDAAERAFTVRCIACDQDASATRILDDIGVSKRPRLEFLTARLCTTPIQASPHLAFSVRYAIRDAGRREVSRMFRRIHGSGSVTVDVRRFCVELVA